MKKPIHHSDANALGVTRRQFLVGSISTGLLMAFGCASTSSDNTASAKATASAVTELANKRFAPTIWFEINPQGKVLVNITKAEMGQHVGTALARIVADELGANWDDVEILHVDTDPKWGYMVTGGSWSVFTSFVPLSQAGAAGRTAIVEAGAALIGKLPSECRTENSKVICGDQSVSFAEIVQTSAIDRTFTEEELAKFKPKAASDRTLIGGQIKALDIPNKANGTAKYGIDVELDGMVYARPLVPPTRYGSVVNAVDDSAAKKINGYLGYEILNDPAKVLQGWVTVLADSFPTAIKAANAIKVNYTAGETAKVSEQDILDKGQALVNDSSSGALFVDDGDIVNAKRNASKTLSATYQTASALHFQLEPVNAVVEFKDGVCHAHTGNQWQSLFLPTIAKSLGLSEDNVIIHQYYLGGGFGRRLAGDYIMPAALTAQAIGKPVKLVFTREDDSRFDCIRSPSVQGMTAYWDGSNQLSGIEHAAAAGWPTLTMAPPFLIDGVDKQGKIDTFSISGADHWYTLPSHRVRAINNPLAQQTFVPGWLRAVGPGWTAWAVESFMDEVAHAQRQDPIAFRLAMLDASGKNAGKAPEAVGGATRLRHTLETVKHQSGWGKSLPANEGLGVALAGGQERTMPTWIACVAHVMVNPTSGQVTVKKLTMVVDCGTVVHPDGALAQTEGAALWGMSLALHEGTRIKDGQVADTNLNTYTPLRMADVPDIDISFVDSKEMPTGLGEPGLIPIAPAIANAIYQAVGVRVRDLPIRPEAIKAGLRS